MKSSVPLPRELQRRINRLAAARARREQDALWRRQRDALAATAADLLAAGRPLADVVRELAEVA
jgi:hypothetical protein